MNRARHLRCNLMGTRTTGSRRDLVLWAGGLAFSLLVGACTAEGSEDEAGEVFFVDGKADGAIAEGSPEALGVLRVANEASVATLKDEAGVASRAAANIIAHRQGSDGRPGTEDDDAFDSLRELDDVPYVGPVTFTRLLAFARARGWTTPSPRALGMNDVSILFPLPRNQGERTHFLWLLPGEGEEGPGFDPRFIPSLPRLNGDVPSRLGYPSAMITALRYDPCARGEDGVCAAQLRLGAQVVITSESGVELLDDAAAHLFYALTDAESSEIVEELAALRALSPVPTDGPLGVHPALPRGMDGPFAAALRALVVEHCRLDNLVRITANAFAMDNWTFTRLDVIDGVLVRRDIPNVAAGGTSQSWLRQAFVNDLEDPSGTILPSPVEEDFSYLLSAASYLEGRPADPDAAGRAARAVLRTENPRLRGTEEVDCASCHLATQARLFAERRGVLFDGEERYVAPRGVDTTLVLSPKLVGNLGATISFGWHTNHDAEGEIEHLSSISQRVINETAEVVDHLAGRHAAP